MRTLAPPKPNEPPGEQAVCDGDAVSPNALVLGAGAAPPKPNLRTAAAAGAAAELAPDVPKLNPPPLPPPPPPKPKSKTPPPGVGTPPH